MKTIIDLPLDPRVSKKTVKMMVKNWLTARSGNPLKLNGLSLLVLTVSAVPINEIVSYVAQAI